MHSAWRGYKDTDSAVHVCRTCTDTYHTLPCMQQNPNDSSGEEIWSDTCAEHAAPSSTSTAAVIHGLLHSPTYLLEGVSISSPVIDPKTCLNPLQAVTTPLHAISVSDATLHEAQVDVTPGADVYTLPSFSDSPPVHNSCCTLQFDLSHDSKRRRCLPEFAANFQCQPCDVGDSPPAAALTGSSPPTACYPASPRILDVLTHQDSAPQQGLSLMLYGISGAGSTSMRQLDSPQVGCMTSPADWSYYALSHSTAGPSCDSTDANKHSSSFAGEQSRRLVQVPSSNHAYSRKQRGQPSRATASALEVPNNMKTRACHQRATCCGMPVLRWGLRKVLCMYQGRSGVR